MAIQFICVGCSQPIEVDDEFAGRSAACPYCRHVVTVPSSSTFHPDHPIPARPLAGRPPVGGAGRFGTELSAEEVAALKLLELRESASREELRAAWRSKAEQWHPDRAADSRKEEFYERYRALQSAFDCLSRAHNEGRLPRQALPPTPTERYSVGGATDSYTAAGLPTDRSVPSGPPPLHVGLPPDVASRAAATYGGRALVCAILVGLLIAVMVVRFGIAAVNQVPPSMDPAEMQSYVQKPEVQEKIMGELQKDRWFMGAHVGTAFFGLVGLILSIVSFWCGGRRSWAAIISAVICAPATLCCMGELLAAFISSAVR